MWMHIQLPLFINVINVILLILARLQALISHTCYAALHERYDYLRSRQLRG